MWRRRTSAARSIRQVAGGASRSERRWAPPGLDPLESKRLGAAVESRLDSGGVGVVVDDGGLEKLPDARA